MFSMLVHSVSFAAYPLERDRLAFSSLFVGEDASIVFSNFNHRLQRFFTLFSSLSTT